MKFIYIFFTALIVSIYHPSSLSQITSHSKTYNLDNIFYFQSNIKIAYRYKNTKCLDFFKKDTNLHIGLFCSSSDFEFLQDFGFYSDHSIMHQFYKKTKRNIEISTGYSIYEMTPMKLNEDILYTATVDCDTENEVIYRANSTCHIGYMERNGYFFYSNFTLSIETKKIHPTSLEEIINIWKSVDSITKIKHEPIQN